MTQFGRVATVDSLQTNVRGCAILVAVGLCCHGPNRPLSVRRERGAVVSQDPAQGNEDVNARTSPALPSVDTGHS